jgi:hypothetical protein
VLILLCIVSILPEASNQLPGFGPLKPEEPVATHKVCDCNGKFTF